MVIAGMSSERVRVEALDRKVRKVTVSLPNHLVRYADRLAGELGTSRREVIGRALSELKAQEQDELAKEGYAFYAEEAKEFAMASAVAVSEAISDAR